MSRLVLHVGLLWVLCFSVLSGTSQAGPGAAEVAIDDCQYANDAAAQAAWQPMRGTSKAMAAVLEGVKALRLPCDFAGSRSERASWDRRVTLDLTSSRGVRFQILCRDASPVSHFALYFESGAGWYAATFFPESAKDWNTIEIDKADMKPEGKPAGWGQIKTVRLSAWRGNAKSTEFYLRDMRSTAVPPPPWST